MYRALALTAVLAACSSNKDPFAGGAIDASGGNDLAPYIFMSDAQAMAAWNGTIKANLQSTYAATFATLADPSKFPGGATLLMNTQYNPFDECAAGPYNVSLVKQAILGEFN